MYRAGIVLFLLGALFTGTVLADEVTLKNGDRLTGTIVSSDTKTLVIKTEAAGVVTSGPPSTVSFPRSLSMWA